jgi:choline dehydrogenase-like flavoprotein
MSALSRRAFLAGSAATMAGPALAAPAGAADFDILIIGAGVAGIAAANRVAATGMKCLVLEAGDHLGGRCFTDTRIFGFPYERGARWIYMPDVKQSWQLRPELISSQRRRVPIYGTDRAMRTPAKQRVFWPVLHAITGPSLAQPSRPMMFLVPRRYRMISMSGERPWSSCSGHLDAASR